jgi:hypothetical protein
MSNEYIAGSVLSVLRYPAKSMMGEELTAADVTHRPVLPSHAAFLSFNRIIVRPPMCSGNGRTNAIGFL